VLRAYFTREIVTTRDRTKCYFDEQTFEKKDLPSDRELIAHIDELLARVSLEGSQAKK
jgi:hypothetical protein